MNDVEIAKLSRSFDHHFQLGPIDLRVTSGEVHGILGPKGAGKTTLLRLIWGFLRPDSGDVFVFGMRPHLEQVKVRLRAGFVSGHPPMYEVLTARQFLRFTGNFYDRWDPQRTRELLAQFDIAPDLPIEKLSQGSRLKLSLVSALGHRPSLLVLDEPASGFGPQIRSEIHRFLKNLAQNEGVSILLSSHIAEDLQKIADRVLKLNDGRAGGNPCYRE